MSVLPTFPTGTSVVFEERWRGILWTAVPHRVIESSPSTLVGWVPAGTRSVYATNRGMPETAGLTREERKLLALETGKAVASEFAESPAKLCIYRPDRWARVNLGFAPEDGGFLGWYVDFQKPVRPTRWGLAAKDLVLDLWINPDRTWRWLDRDAFDRAIAQGLVAPQTPDTLRTEADRIIAEAEDHAGPFVDEYADFTADPSWEHPTLPPSHSWDGDEWTLPTGERRV